MRLDEIPALDLWDLIVFVHGNTIQTLDRSGQPVVDGDKDHGPNKRSQGMINVLNNIDCVHSNVQFPYQEALLLYVFEDNEAVTKMTIKRRSPTMRLVSRTHRVALDWLFDRINLDPKIKIKYIDTKKQLADILTKGNFTRDEWNHLLNLFNISHFSSTVCTAAMAKRAQQESGEERVAAKSRPMMHLSARMPSVVSSSTSSNPGRAWYGYQDPGDSVAINDRSGKPDRLSPAGYSKEDYGSPQKTNLPTFLAKDISHVTSGIICCGCSISAHFSSTVCSGAMAKRLQQGSGEERVTAKSQPKMSLIVRAPRICHPRR